MLFCPQQTDFFVLSLFSSKSNCSRLYSSCSQFYLLCHFEALFKKLFILLLPFQKEKHALSKKQEIHSFSSLTWRLNNIIIFVYNLTFGSMIILYSLQAFVLSTTKFGYLKRRATINCPEFLRQGQIHEKKTFPQFLLKTCAI